MTGRAQEHGPDAIDVEVGITVRRLRKERGIRQEGLGKALGITSQQSKSMSAAQIASPRP